MVSILFGSIDETMQHHFTEAKTSKAVWDVAKTIHRAAGQGIMRRLIVKFISYIKSETRTIDEGCEP